MKEDWINCKLGDLLRLKNGFAFKSSKYTKEGIPVLRIGDIYDWNVNTTEAQRVKEETEYDSYIVNKGDILIAMSGATTGKFGIYKSEEKAYQNQRVGNLIPYCKKFLDKNFVFYLLYSLKREIEKEAYGGAQPNISAIKIEALNTTLAPLPFQRAIVLKIENLFASLDKGIADLKTAQEQLKVYRQAVLKKAFEGEFTNSKMQFLKLINITTTLGDGLHGTPKYSENGEYYFINGNNLSDGKILIKPETKRVDKEEFEKYKKNLNQSTVLVSINGTIGNTAFYKDEPVILGKSACYFNVAEGISKEYIQYNLKTSAFINYAIKNATGSTIKNVGLKTMRNYLVPVPVNKNEQNQIVREIESRLSVCDKVEQSIAEALVKAEALRQSILKKAFEGKLLSEAEIDKCKQEADYEPASELLKKIKAEKK